MNIPCPYCRYDISEKDMHHNNYAQCEKCQLPFHRECYELNGKCMCFGCGGKAALPITQESQKLHQESVDIVVRNHFLAAPDKAITAHMRILEDIVTAYTKASGEHNAKVQHAIQSVCSNAFPSTITSLYVSYLTEYNHCCDAYQKIATKMKDVKQPAILGNPCDVYSMGAMTGAAVGAIVSALFVGGGGYPAWDYLISMFMGAAVTWSMRHRAKEWYSVEKLSADYQKAHLQKAYKKKLLNLTKRYEQKFLTALP